MGFEVSLWRSQKSWGVTVEVGVGARAATTLPAYWRGEEDDRGVAVVGWASWLGWQMGQPGGLHSR